MKIKVKNEKKHENKKVLTLKKGNMNINKEYSIQVKLDKRIVSIYLILFPFCEEH